MLEGKGESRGGERYRKRGKGEREDGLGLVVAMRKRMKRDWCAGEE